MAVAWGGICSSEPPSVAISVRKVRYTYHNLMDRKAFTISIPSEKFVKQSDYFGIVSGKNEDKFENTGLKPVPSKIVDAPYVGEFPLVLECRVTRTTDLGAHTQFVGEIKDVKVDEDCLDEEGVPDVSKNPARSGIRPPTIRIMPWARTWARRTGPGAISRQKKRKECSPSVGPGHDPEG